MKTGHINGKKREMTFVDVLLSGKREKEVAALTTEVNMWAFYSLEQRRVVARSLALSHQERTDPTSYARIFNRLMNAVETPQDYGMTVQAMHNLCGKPGFLKTLEKVAA